MAEFELAELALGFSQSELRDKLIELALEHGPKLLQKGWEWISGKLRGPVNKLAKPAVTRGRARTIAEGVLRRIRSRQPRGAVGGLMGNAQMGKLGKSRAPTYKMHPSGKSVVINGSDYLMPVTTGTNSYFAGERIAEVVISPSGFGRNRLALFANMYEKFQFTKILVTYHPVCGSDTAGGIAGYYDWDPKDDAGNEGKYSPETTLSEARARPTFRQAPVWGGGSERLGFEATDLIKDKLYYCQDRDSAASDERLTMQGKFYLIATSELKDSLSFGHLTVDYVCTFTNPQLEANSFFVNTGEWIGETSCTATAPLGTVVKRADWSHCDSEALTESGASYIVTPPGHWWMWSNITGTVVSAPVMTKVDGDFTILETDNGTVSGGSGYNVTIWQRGYSTTGCVIALTLTATTVTKTRVMVSQLPDVELGSTEVPSAGALVRAHKAIALRSRWTLPPKILDETKATADLYAMRAGVAKQEQKETEEEAPPGPHADRDQLVVVPPPAAAVGGRKR